MTPYQKIVENWRGTLVEFAAMAVQTLHEHPYYDEVVIYANMVVELEKDCVTPPARMHTLPDGFEYNFSGFYGQVLGVRRLGPWGKY